ncbi:hypothetical protein HZA73_06090 [candidate division TA06 bacterium]|nr:hypothetical protein [candidate division TA06 bacterium]
MKRIRSDTMNEHDDVWLLCSRFRPKLLFEDKLLITALRLADGYAITPGNSGLWIIIINFLGKRNKNGFNFADGCGGWLVYSIIVLFLPEFVN